MVDIFLMELFYWMVIMFYVSELHCDAPSVCHTELQKRVYSVLSELNIPFERAETDEAITMDDCASIEEKMNMRMVKTLFLCDRKQQKFYLFITRGDKVFNSKEFSHALGIPRVSFAPVPVMEAMMGTKVGAATVFSALLDKENKVHIVFDKDVLSETWYGCSDGTTTGYLKIRMSHILEQFLPYTGHEVFIMEG